MTLLCVILFVIYTHRKGKHVFPFSLTFVKNAYSGAHLEGVGGGYIPCPQKEKCLWTGHLPRKYLIKV